MHVLILNRIISSDGIHEMFKLFYNFNILLILFFTQFFAFTNAIGVQPPDGYYLDCSEEFIVVIPGNFMPNQKSAWRYTSVSEQIDYFNNQYKIPVLKHNSNSWTYKYDLNVDSMMSYRRSKFTRISDGYWFVNVTKGSPGVAIEKGIVSDTSNHTYLHDRDWGERCSKIDIKEPFNVQNYGVIKDSCM